MISITKVFRFETAHALFHYPGSCAQIHGHSYELHVTVAAKEKSDEMIGGLGIVLDFKELKAVVKKNAVDLLDHKLILSRHYLTQSKTEFRKDELVVFEAEPSAENMLLFLRARIVPYLPSHSKLISLKLWETRDSFAEWSAD